MAIEVVNGVELLSDDAPPAGSVKWDRVTAPSAGYTFGQTVYWKNSLGDKPYTITALKVEAEFVAEFDGDWYYKPAAVWHYQLSRVNGGRVKEYGWMKEDELSLNDS